jgi:2,3-bisphosphoglycerate-independent phosphoglycerate mutase
MQSPQDNVAQPQARAVLLILDGLGLNEDPAVSATTSKQMPFLHSLMEANGYASLQASGSDVGLDAGKAGNSEVGHLTIGAGRVLPSTLGRIRDAYRDGTWEKHTAWEHCDTTRPLHVAGLLSDAGVHAHWETLVMAADIGARKGFPAVYIHALLDGTDSQAGTAGRLLQELKEAIVANGSDKIRLASVMGRKWATDRAENWEVTQHCKDALMGRLESGEFSPQELQQHLERSASEADFPYATFSGGIPVAPGDTLILTNHRADRVSQLAKLMSKDCHVIAMVELKHEAVPLEDVFFPAEVVSGGLIDVLKQQGYTTVRLSEQCKFPHVTYFINGMQGDDSAQGVEVPTIPDDEILGKPAMSITLLAGELERLMAEEPAGQVLIVNVPNLDQVGHQGSLEAAAQAASAVDELVKNAVGSWAKAHGWQVLITADHGNADVMVDARGRPMGSHSTSPVPMIAISQDGRTVEWRKRSGDLSNVAASLLALIGTDYPESMSESLIALH